MFVLFTRVTISEAQYLAIRGTLTSISASIVGSMILKNDAFPLSSTSDDSKKKPMDCIAIQSQRTKSTEREHREVDCSLESAHFAVFDNRVCSLFESKQGNISLAPFETLFLLFHVRKTNVFHSLQAFVPMIE